MSTAKPFVLIVALLGTALAVHASKRAEPKKHQLTAADCERLVNQLVNPNEPPFQGKVFDPPANLKGGDQTPMQQAYDRLSDNIEAALPVLVKHAHDGRFSYVHEDFYSGACITADVGDACREIIEAHVEVYQPCIERTLDGIPQSLSFIDDACGGTAKWWKARQGRSLAELQLEACEWVLRHKKPSYFTSGKAWTRALKRVKKLVRRIRESKQPILREHHVQFFSG
jgi:hypothetical protein